MHPPDLDRVRPSPIGALHLMMQHLKPGLPLLLGGLLIGSLSCRPASTETAPAPPVDAVVETEPIEAEPEPEPEPAATDYFQEAIERATSAVNITQRAQSQDDWRLAINRWQQAIALLQAVPQSSANYPQAQTKITEYQQNLSYAEQQANRPVAASSDGVVVVTPQAAPSTSSLGTATQPSPAPVSSSVFRAPIVSRAGGTPVVNVTFNGRQSFPMIVDTGASGTVITPAMANALGVVRVGETTVSTASARNVSFGLGYVNSMEAGGAIANNVLVAVSTPELDLGLLGHDFFGDYDVVLGQDYVEFRER
ncbi:MAG: retroviral-like aspartic protease family protein [Synechococcales cyanobacterium K44_A2020_017]|nr:retroviral-like aspartic protease family protein [Synechococcales cyanobacterium K44_A2020_017]